MVNELVIFAFSLLALFIIPPTSAIAAPFTYYVSPSGNDSNTNNQAQNSATPWKTIQKAAETMAAGDTVIVKEGDYTADGVVQITKSGSATGGPITYQAQGKAVVKGFYFGWDSYYNYIHIKGFEINANYDSTQNTNDGDAGISVSGSWHVIEDNYVHNVGDGIRIFGYPHDNTRAHDNIVKNNKITQSVGNGISVFGYNNRIENNEIWGLYQCYPPTGSKCVSDADGIRFFGQGHTFKGNYIHDIPYGPVGVNPSIGDFVADSHTDCFQTFARTDTDYELASNILFEGNICDNLQFQNKEESGMGWMIGGDMAEDVDAGANNITIKNNIIRAHHGINTHTLTDWTHHLYIYNNTFINDLSFGDLPNAADLFNATGSIIKNNIFYNQKNSSISLAGDITGIVVDYNLIYNTDGSLPSYLPYPQLHELRKVDPNFVNAAAKDYHLQPNILDTNDRPVPNPACTGGEGGTYIGAFPCVKGDANNDNKVDGIDYVIWLTHYDQSVTGATNGDFNGSGKVDGVDYVVWLNNYGK